MRRIIRELLKKKKFLQNVDNVTISKLCVTLNRSSTNKKNSRRILPSNEFATTRDNHCRRYDFDNNKNKTKSFLYEAAKKKKKVKNNIMVTKQYEKKATLEKVPYCRSEGP